MVGKAGLTCILELIGIGCNIGYSPSSVFLWGEPRQAYRSQPILSRTPLTLKYIYA